MSGGATRVEAEHENPRQPANPPGEDDLLRRATFARWPTNIRDRYRLPSAIGRRRQRRAGANACGIGVGRRARRVAERLTRAPIGLDVHIGPLRKVRGRVGNPSGPTRRGPQRLVRWSSRWLSVPSGRAPSKPTSVLRMARSGLLAVTRSVEFSAVGREASLQKGNDRRVARCGRPPSHRDARSCRSPSHGAEVVAERQRCGADRPVSPEDPSSRRYPDGFGPASPGGRAVRASATIEGVSRPAVRPQGRERDRGRTVGQPGPRRWLASDFPAAFSERPPNHARQGPTDGTPGACHAKGRPRQPRVDPFRPGHVRRHRHRRGRRRREGARSRLRGAGRAQASLGVAVAASAPPETGDPPGRR